MLYYPSILRSHYFDVINKSADYGAIQACFGHKDTVICIDLY